MKNKSIIISGASGLVGTALSEALIDRGHVVLGLTRGGQTPRTGIEWLEWKPGAPVAHQNRATVERFASADFVVNLAGQSIGDGRFTQAAKKKIMGSRIDATETLGAMLRHAGNGDAHILQASAVGFYGDSGEIPATEDSDPGEMFLSKVCVQWEGCARGAFSADRLAIFRLGVVLGPGAPAWQKMLLPIRLGLGGPLGSGQQWLSWVSLEDCVDMLLFLLDRGETGVWNATASEAIRQGDLVRQVGKYLKRPAWLPAPAWALKIGLGEMADELVLASCHAPPARFEAQGFQFKHPNLAEALPYLIG